MIDAKNNKIRFNESASKWISSFDLSSIKCLIVCRGPVRKEAMDIFDEIGIREYGILLSEKDSVVYPMALAPELRGFRFINNIHRVPDYMGAGKEEKDQRIIDILSIAKSNGYTHIFAGYGFMAEDAEFIEAIEKSGITFMGPASSVARQAGAKDEAKKIARKLNVSVTPGIDNITALTLISKCKDKAGLEAAAKSNKLDFKYNDAVSLEDNAETLLQLSYAAVVDLVTIPELQDEALVRSEEIWKKYPSNRIRFKYIGGGGGKGQRVIKEKSQVKDAVMEILAESKVTSVGSNRNFLIELNIENTRHNEIQLVGNGEWSLSLGGRDCSLQMHEQKLLEISNTVELLEEEIKNAENPQKAAVLKGDLQVLKEMEEQSERFGAAVKLNSVSTFESIVEGTNHFFMEMNTRIQVEHRVTEMAYRLKFTNPADKNDYFILESLIECMALLSLHGKRVPKPERILRNISGGEIRVNATNQSLQPHAGGVIQTWSPPIEHEIRDDQGIGVKNPDTNIFIHYKLAGAYDSNVALIVSYGKSRRENLERLSEIIRVTELRGNDLQTNMPVHYGLINWILGKDPMFKPNTRYMMSYLAGIGSLFSYSKDVDAEIVWAELSKQILAKNPERAKVLARKMTLILRPIKEVCANPHILAGFIGFNSSHSWKEENGKVKFLINPVRILNDLYRYLNLEKSEKKAPCDQIWDHDAEILEAAISFYDEIDSLSGKKLNLADLDALFAKDKNPFAGKISDESWAKCRESHTSFQLGMSALSIIPGLGIKSGFSKLGVDANLDPIVPDEFANPDSMNKLVKLLNPPPKAKSDEIVAPMGGMFYSREAPNLPVLISEGDQFKAGQPLFIIEVMKMFNKIAAPFSGTVVKNMMNDSDGKIVSKGQTIFKIQPDEILQEETPEEILARRKALAAALLN
ncbi:MAG TPA: biotin carboxylase N-terminal domain-containing protein [Leptospiraceae bacterium]|nr:biotin carboxylase N-terminal domain-containing protein [Leptospiraceae bacterium]HNI95354.1 biotin carboxylase N-terminal domain-containing protein [Leptospiraceae bacterium]